MKKFHSVAEKKSIENNVTKLAKTVDAFAIAFFLYSKTRTKILLNMVTCTKFKSFAYNELLNEDVRLLFIDI